MAWAWPRYKPSTSYMLDWSDFNENILSFAQEADGNLGEHNFFGTALGALWEAGQVAEDVALRLHHQENTDTQAIPYTADWRPISGTEKEFDSQGGKALVIYSVNVDHGVLGVGVDDTVAGLNFCIEIDGTPRMDTLVGSGDIGNEFVGRGEATEDFPWIAGPGMRGKFRVQLFGIFDLLPGRHRIRLLARALHGYGNGEPVVDNRELIVLDMWT